MCFLLLLRYGVSRKPGGAIRSSQHPYFCVPPQQNARLSQQHLLRKIKPTLPSHVERIICIISPSVRWKQNNNWFALFSVCVVKQLGINLRITVQLILNAKDGVCGGGGGGALIQRKRRGYTDWGQETTTLCFCCHQNLLCCCIKTVQIGIWNASERNGGNEDAHFTTPH